MDPLERLVVQQAIVENYNCYARGIDTKDWSLVRSCFSDSIFIDYGELDPNEEQAQVPRSAEDWLAQLQSVINGFDTTHHAITNHQMSVAGDRISCRAYLVADHVILPDVAMPETGPEAGAEDICTVVGEYNNDYEQQPDGRWTICYSRLYVKWSSGNTGVFVTAAERVAAANPE
ncbi:MAG: nuclear transport factor 2 family protein [Halioglobus sp.]